jgi:protease-3
MSDTRVYFGLLVLTAVMLVQSCATSVSPSSAAALQTIPTSPNDNRQYSTFTLPNQLQVVLISDPSLEVSGASLSVGVGSYQNPKAIPGLAHYLEHMLFLGTKKYPEPNGFQTFLQKNGGSANAYTASDHTNYHFQVGAGALTEALDRYSDYFLHPTFDKTYSDKERKAVHSEWSMGKANDGRIVNRLRGITANPAHPAQQMSVGNLNTLVDTPDQTLHSAMLDFYQRYYSANNMKLVLFGKQNTSTLQQLAVSYFSDINNNGATRPRVKEAGLTTRQLGQHIYYQPQKPMRKLVVEFAINNNTDQWAVKPNRYIINLLSSEEPGTAAQVLRQKGWIDNLTASANPDFYGRDGIFTVNIGLTEQGLKQQDKILATVFKYVDLIRESGVEPVYFNEFQAMLAKQYQDLQVPSALDQAKYFSRSLFSLPAQHLNDAYYTYSHFDKAAIKQVLAQLTPARARVWHINPKANVTTDIPYYQGQYRVTKFTDKTLQHWKKLGQSIQLTLPSKNDLFSTGKSKVVDASVLQPRQVVDEKGIEAWLTHSQYHQSEQGYLQVMFNTNLPLLSAKNYVMSELVNRIFALQTTPLRDKAGRAGIGIGIERPKNNHALTLSGYSEKHPLLYQRLLKRWVTMPINSQELAVAKQGFADWLHGRAKEEASRQLFTELDRLMVKPSWTDEQLAQALGSITLSELNRYQKSLTENNRVRIFSFGNYTQAKVKNIANITQQTLPSSWKKRERFVAKVNKPVIGAQVSFKNTIKTTDNGLLHAYYTDDKSLTTAAQLYLLNSVFRQAFFNQLRTEQQVGYVVGSSIDRVGDYWGFLLYAQSPHTSLKRLNVLFNQFIDNYLAVLQQLDTDELQQLKATLVAQINQVPDNFYKEYPRYLNDFYRGNNRFDSRQKLVSAINSTTKSDIIARYQSLLIKHQAYRVKIKLQGTKNQ